MYEIEQQDETERTNDEAEVRLIKCEDSTPHAPKRRRPRVQQEDFREWTHEETKKLCELWRDEEVLYNSRHPKNHLKEVKDQAITRITEQFTDADIAISENNVLNKMSSLRAYYSGQLSKIKRSIQSEGSEPVYQSPWKFMDDMKFLSKAIVPRNKIPYSQTIAQSVAKSPKGYSSPESSSHFFIEHSESVNGVGTTVEDNGNRNSNSTKNNSFSNTDGAFCEMIRNILCSIPAGEIKDMLKLKIHQQTIEAKYKAIQP